MEYKCLGLELDHSGEHFDIAHPLEVLVVVKGLDSRDGLAYWVLWTRQLSPVEAAGMARFAQQVVEDRLDACTD
jgi:hypothetical protein